MSIHPTLRSSEKDKKQRSILKRTERLRIMMEKGQWKEGDDCFGLPKIKTIKFKIKKEKTAEKAETAATAETAVPAAETKEHAKPQAAKSQDKK